MRRSRVITLVSMVAVFFQLSALANEPIAAVPSVIEAALGRRLPPHEFQLRFHGLDCSHLVHALYGSLGLHYRYATSRTLYSGIRPFQRVSTPALGDLVVWRGHVGIVVNPLQHRFLSALTSGVKVSSYLSGYWQRRGTPRFFRYALPDGIEKSQSDPEFAIASADAH